MWKFAWRNIKRRKGQSFLTILITMLSIMIFVMIFVFYTVFSQGISLAEKRLGADILILPNEASTDEYMTLFTAKPNNMYMPVSVLDDIRKINGIEKASPQFFTQTLNAGCCAVDTETRLIGFDIDTDFVLKPWLVELNIEKLEDNEIIIGSNIPGFLGNRTVILGQLFEVVGNMSPTGTGMDDTYFVNIDVAKQLATNSSYMQDMWKNEKPKDLYSAILVKIKSDAVISEVVEQINRADLNIQVVTTGDVIAGLKRQMFMISSIMILFWLMLLVVTALSLMGRFSSIAQVRKKEIGILRAVGGLRVDVFRLVIYEACILASIGGLIGSILGTCGVIPLIDWLKKGFSFSTSPISFLLVCKSVGIGLLLSIILGCISAFYPSYKSSKLEPKEVITKGDMSL